MLHPLLALGFGTPALLWGLGLASAPILIHLLSRRKYREREWAAMKWLLAALEKNARRIRLEQLILLAVRTALVVCVALAMAKPFVQGAGAVLMPGKRTHRVLVIDGSFSMGYRLTDRDRFERAKEVALAILHDARKGDAASLLIMAAPPRVVVGDASANLAAVGEEIKGLTLMHGGADLMATLTRLDEILAASTLDQREVYFLTDLQRTTWAAAESSAPLRELAVRIAQRANLVLVDLGQGSTENTAVVSLDTAAPFVIVGRDTPLAATIENFGRTHRPELAVTLLVDGEIQDRRAVDLPAGQRETVTFSHAFSSAGHHVAEVQLEDDALPIDNHRWLALEAKEQLDVLLVDGEPSSETFGSETDYLRVALAPDLEANQPAAARSPIRPEVVRESDFAETDLGRYDCVILANVGQFTDNEAKLLDAYLRRGGAVVWFLGDQVDAPSYNRVLFRDGQGIFPAELAAHVGNAKDAQGYLSFDPLGYAHPIVQAFRGAEEGGLLTTKVFEYVRAQLPEGSHAQVALAYEGGDPAILMDTVERGRVAVVTTTADIAWTNWPIWASYVPVMNELVMYVTADRHRQRNVMVGESISVPVPPSAIDVPVTVQLPDGRAVPTRVVPRDEVSYFGFDQTQRSGAYHVSFGPPLAIQEDYAVNVSPSESNLAKLDQDELSEAMPGVSWRYLTNWQAIATGRSSVTQNRGELHRALLYAALGLVFMESFLAWKFGHYAV